MHPNIPSSLPPNVGFCVAASVGGEVLWQHCLGAGDFELAFSVASVTKPIVATALCRLGARGVLSIKEPVERFTRLTYRCGSAEEVTLGRLSNHTSGLPLHYHFYAEGIDPAPPSIEESIRRYGTIVRAPAEENIYSNFGYGILGHAIEIAAGRPLKEILQEEVFDLAGMSQSIFAPTEQEWLRCAPRVSAGGEVLPRYVTDHPAASEAFCSVRDLLALGDLFCRERAEWALAMQAPIESSAAAQFFGIGWRLGKTATGKRLLGHSGGMDGVRARLVVVPEEGIVFAAAANTSAEWVERAIDDFERQVLTREPISGPDMEACELNMLGGTWRGSISTFERDVAVEMEVGDYVKVRLGDEAIQIAAVLTDAPGILRVRIPSALKTSDAMRRRHDVELRVKRDGARLFGRATAISPPDERLGNALSHWIALEK